MIRIIISLIQKILSELNYVFDKESKTLTMQGIIKKSSSLEIPLNRIAKIHLEKYESSSQTLLLIDESGSQLLSIEIFNFQKAQKIACAICSFLEIELYQTIVIPP